MERKRNASGLIDSCKVVVKDIGQGLLIVSHNTLALLGLVVLAAGLIAFGRTDVRASVEDWAFGWLQQRQEARVDAHDEPAEGEAAEPTNRQASALASDFTAAERATAADPRDLTTQQAAVATWIARRYKVAPEPIGRLVQEAWEVGSSAKLEPTLILAIMAVESSFNPFAQSSVGAQGLMQVMTRVHDKKYEPFGGSFAAFDPVSNLRVGVQVLKECIQRAGNLYDGLRHYVGAANLPTDGGYASKVLGEHAHLVKVAAGKAVPHTAPIVPVPAPVSPDKPTLPSMPAPAPSTPSDNELAKPLTEPPSPGDPLHTARAHPASLLLTRVATLDTAPR